MREFCKLVIIISSMVLMSVQMYGQNVGIGANTFTPDNSALLELQSTNSGLLLPRMTTAQRDAISNPAQSLLIFNTTSECFETYINNRWRQIWCNCGTTVIYNGVIYNTIQIGDQCWMKENLRTTKYNNSDSIPNVTDDSTWTSTTSGAYCCYGNDPSNCVTYGALYNGYAVNTGKLCPSGWHVPSDAEWQTLEMFLGMTQANLTNWRGINQGSMLAGNANLWKDGALEQNINFGASGFSALPGGWRDNSFYNLGIEGCWWSNTEYGISTWYRKLSSDSTSVFRNSYDKKGGFSVRCLRD
jgi:uncharacterized protein (TIGR02145 family)